MKFINKYRSPNFDKRKKGAKVQYIIIHYTAMRSDIDAINYLCDKKNKVSTHLLISKKGKIFNLVIFKNRAWHAGKSYWKGETDINSNSIGIEIDNSGKLIDFENYNNFQILSLIKLLKFIKKKYNISFHNILGHSDIAPYRKIDPGEKFPWLKLSNLNISYFPNNKRQLKNNQIDDFFKNKKLISIKKKVLFMLNQIGYDINQSKKSNKNYVLLIKAYQSHYRAALVNGKIDKITYKIILNHYTQILTT